MGGGFHQPAAAEAVTGIVRSAVGMQREPHGVGEGVREALRDDFRVEPEQPCRSGGH